MPQTIESYTLSQSAGQPNARREWTRLYAQAREQYPEVVKTLRHLGRGDTVVDIGCGPGASLPLLKASGFQAMVGIDSDTDALDFAAKTARALGVDFHPVPSDLTSATLNLPIGIAPAAMAMNVVIHTGFAPVLGAARQLLSADGLLAIADRDYARLEVWDSPSVEALVSLIRPLVMRGDRDYHRAELAAETFGFRAVAGDCGRWQILEGARILDAFSFVGCMNESASAQRLKQALAHVAQDPDLPSAKLRVVDRWVVLKRESVRMEADRG